jgi:hypothetical protein
MFLKLLLKFNDFASNIFLFQEPYKHLSSIFIKFHLDFLSKNQQVVLCEMVAHTQQQNPHRD